MLHLNRLAGPTLKPELSRRRSFMDLKRAMQLICLIFALPAVAAAQEAIKFTAAASSKVLGFAPLWAASGMGFLRREGLDSEVTAIRGTAATMQALVSDSIYVALSAND